MTIQLREYQQELADKVRDAYRAGYKCPLVRLETGGGKTILFSHITKNAAARGNSVLILAHRAELIRQISLSLAKFGVEHQVIAPPSAIAEIRAAHFRAYSRVFVDQRSSTMVGSVQTVARRLDTMQHTPKLIIQDEGQHCTSGTLWGAVMDKFSDALGLVVTATPARLDGKGLGKSAGGYADTLIETVDMAWLIDNGYLSPYRVFTTGTRADVSGVRTTKKGDYHPGDLAERVDKPSLVGDAVEHYKQAARGLLAVCYCVSVEHSKHVAEQFNAAGIPAAHFDGKTASNVRSEIVRDFADGKIQVLTNVGILTEGFDLASISQRDVTIDCVIDLAPTQSLSLYLQKVGRALRPRAGKIAIILDHAGNVLKHGLPDMKREWTLEGRTKKSRASDEASVSVRTCPKCFAIHEPVIPACPACGFLYPIQNRTVEHVDGQLVELTSADRASLKQQMEAQKRMEAEKRKREDRKAGSLEELVELGKSRGYKFPAAWAAKKWEAMQRAREHHRAGVY